MFVTLAYIVLQLWDNRLELKDSFNYTVLAATLFCTAVFTALVCFNPFLFSLILSAVTGKKQNYKKVAPIYLKSNMYKYLPGNVMHYIGRNQLAVDTDLKHGEVAFSSLAEAMLSMTGAIIGGTLFAGKYMLDAVTTYINIKYVVYAFSFFVIIFFLIVAVFKSKVFILFEKLKSIILSKNIYLFIAVLFCMIISLALNGFIFAVVLISMDVKLNLVQIIQVLGISMIAWLVGFVTPGSPGGLGIREAMLSVLLSHIAPISILAAAAVIYRCITIFGDILAYLVIKILIKDNTKSL